MGENNTYDFEGKGKELHNRVMEPALAYRYNGAGDKTLEDYLALPEGTRVELVDGVFYDMASPTMLHQSVAFEICATFRDHIRKSGGNCTPFIAPADVQVFHDDRTMVQPDVFIVCDREQITRARVVGAPDLVVEVASPGNWRMDAIIKRQKYFEAGVREYWIVFPEDKRVLVYQFEGSDKQESIQAAVYTFADKVSVGIWDGRCQVDFAEIYETVRFMYEER